MGHVSKTTPHLLDCRFIIATTTDHHPWKLVQSIMFNWRLVHSRLLTCVNVRECCVECGVWMERVCVLLRRWRRRQTTSSWCPVSCYRRHQHCTHRTVPQMEVRPRSFTRSSRVRVCVCVCVCRATWLWDQGISVHCETSHVASCWTTTYHYQRVANTDALAPEHHSRARFQYAEAGDVQGYRRLRPFYDGRRERLSRPNESAGSATDSDKSTVLFGSFSYVNGTM